MRMRPPISPAGPMHDFSRVPKGSPAVRRLVGAGQIWSGRWRYLLPALAMLVLFGLGYVADVGVRPPPGCPLSGATSCPDPGLTPPASSRQGLEEAPRTVLGQHTHSPGGSEGAFPRPSMPQQARNSSWGVGLSPGLAVVVAALPLGDQVLLVLAQRGAGGAPSSGVWAHAASDASGAGGREDAGGQAPAQLRHTESTPAQGVCAFWSTGGVPQLTRVLQVSTWERGQAYVRCSPPTGTGPQHVSLAAPALPGASLSGNSGLAQHSPDHSSPREVSQTATAREHALVPPAPHSCSWLSPFLPVCSPRALGEAVSASAWRGDQSCGWLQTPRFHAASAAPPQGSALRNPESPGQSPSGDPGQGDPSLLYPTCALLTALTQREVEEPQRWLRVVMTSARQQRGLYLFVKGLKFGVPGRATRFPRQADRSSAGAAGDSLGTLDPVSLSDQGPGGGSPTGTGDTGAGARRGLGARPGNPLNVTCLYGDCWAGQAKAGAMEVVLCPLPPDRCLGRPHSRQTHTADGARPDVSGGGTPEAESGGVLVGQSLPVSLRDARGVVFPSLAWLPDTPTFSPDWEAPPGAGPLASSRLQPGSRPPGVAPVSGAPRVRKTFFVCSCTMVWNVAKFLREWLLFHHWMGVDRFFLYDNNSDDNITGVAEDFSAWVAGNPDFVPHRAGQDSGSKAGIGDWRAERGQQARLGSVATVHAWPWLKSQQSGFSHCLLRAAPLCTWVLFTDVDEFVRPKFLNQLQSKEAVRQFVADKGPMLLHLMAQVAHNVGEHLQARARPGSPLELGQICLQCLEFGPSGQSKHPEEGVTPSYTCRNKSPHRHKCMVRPEAVVDSLFTRIHEFELQPGFASNIDFNRGKERLGWLNHYRYQAWDEFKNKFLRRVATQVADWGKSRESFPGTGGNLKVGRDRDPSLQHLEPDKMPADWLWRFCQKNDSVLQNLVQMEFTSHKQTFEKPVFLWQDHS